VQFSLSTPPINNLPTSSLAYSHFLITHKVMVVICAGHKKAILPGFCSICFHDKKMHLWNVNKLYMNEHYLLKKSKSWLCLSFQVFTFTLCLQPHCIVLLFQVGRVFSGWVCFLRFCSFCLFCDIQAEHLPPWSWNHVKQKSKYYKGWKTVLDMFAVNFNPEQRPTEVGRLEPKWMMSEFKLPLFHSWVVLA
jgi:hypothetical protein